MRRRVAALGALLLLAAAFLYTNPSFGNPISASFGQAGQTTFLERNVLVRITSQNYSYYEVPLATGDSIAVSFAANPGGVDVFLMNQGNFTLWAASEQGSYTYAEAALRVSNYSFEFTNMGQGQNFYVVLASHSAEATSVLMHVVGARPSQLTLLLLPSILGLIGVLSLAYGLRGGRAKQESRKSEVGRSGPQPSSPPPPVEFCRYCGAVLRPGSQFCLSCHRSQI